jgi:ABC-type nitrate/sulfonate/bicarbonate transport system substrate-binding protein
MQAFFKTDPDTFDPETVDFLVRALDDAWRYVEAEGVPLNGQERLAREALAKYIIDAAAAGERDHQRLVENALLRFRL